MYVNVAVLKETQPHERRVALVPSVVPKLIKLGAKLHMQSGAGDAIKLADAAFKDVAFIDDRKALVADADVVLAVQPPALDVIDAMKEGAILISFIYAEQGRRWCSACWRRRSPASPWSACRASRGRRRWTRCRASPRLAGYLRRATRRDASRPHPAEDHDGRRRDRAGQGAGDGPRRRRAGSDRDRASSGRRRRRL
jgi:hypothetical protein